MRTDRSLALNIFILVICPIFLFSCHRSDDLSSGIVGKEIRFVNQQAGVTLAGILILPEGKGPFPAAVIVGGSGNYRLGPYHVLIANALAKRGIAALCYNKRGLGDSTGNFKSATTLDLEKDALAGFEFLRNQPGVDPRKVGMIGHSEGGLIAPMAASESKDIAFVVLLAAPGIIGDKRFTLQGVHVALAEGADDRVIQVIKDMTSEAFPMLETQNNEKAARKKLGKIFDSGFSKLNEKEKGQLKEVLERDPKALADHMLTPWYRYLLLWDPKDDIRKMKCPVLVLNGDKDVAVVYPDNLNAVAQALKDGGNSDYAVKVFPDLNHLFQHCKTGAPNETIPPQDTMAPEVIQYIGDWILKHSK